MGNKFLNRKEMEEFLKHQEGRKDKGKNKNIGTYNRFSFSCCVFLIICDN
jgi:hypothetical protein